MKIYSIFAAICLSKHTDINRHRRHTAQQELQEANEWWEKKSQWILQSMKEEALIFYKSANISDEDIENFVKNNVTTHEIVKNLSDALFSPVIYILFTLILLQCCVCQLPCFWYLGCCCFKNCSKIKRKGFMDKETGDVYVPVRDYLKYGCFKENREIL